MVTMGIERLQQLVQQPPSDYGSLLRTTLFRSFVRSCVRFVTALLRQSKDVAMTSTIICRMALTNGRLATPLTALSSWCRLYSSNVRKSDPSAVRRIGLVSWAPTIDVITAAMASFTPIAAIVPAFCLSALSCALAFVVISGATMFSFEMAALASAIDCFLTSLFLMATFYW